MTNSYKIIMFVIVIVCLIILSFYNTDFDNDVPTWNDVIVYYTLIMSVVFVIVTTMILS